MNNKSGTVCLEVTIPKSGTIFLGTCIRYLWKIYNQSTTTSISSELLNGSIDISDIIDKYKFLEKENRMLLDDICHLVSINDEILEKNSELAYLNKYKDMQWELSVSELNRDDDVPF